MNSILFRINRLTVGAVTAIVLTLGVQNSDAGQHCNGTSPYVCVEMANEQPEIDVHYALDLQAPNGPEITLIAGNTGWKVWSQASSTDTTPANIGDIKIDASAQNDVFELKIENASAGPGAANVGSIILSDATNWTGYSSLTGGRITGSLTGGVQVVSDSSDLGGTIGRMDGQDIVPFIIDGTISSSITAEEIIGLEIGGVSLAGINADVSGSLKIGTTDNFALGSDPFTGPSTSWLPIHEVTGDVVIETVLIDSTNSINSSFRSGSSFTIEAFASNGRSLPATFLKLYGGFDGTLNVQNRVPVGTAFGVTHEVQLGTTAKFNFRDASMNPVSIDGTLFLDGGAKEGFELNAGVLNGQFLATAGGGANCVEESCTEDCDLIACNPDGSFSGKATFSSVSLGGLIMSGKGGIPGSFDGELHILEDLNGTFLSCFSAGECVDFDGLIRVYGDLDGVITTTNSINPPGDMTGEIIVGGKINGSIDIGDEYTGNICATNVLAGGPIMEGITFGSIGQGATLCDEGIHCLSNNDCDDQDSGTADICHLNRCWHPQNSSTLGAPVAAPRSYQQVANNRYLVFDPNNDGGVALRVRLQGETEALGWVGEPAFNGISQVVNSAVYPTSWPGVITLADCEIRPNETYEIHATDDGSTFSSAFTISTTDAPTAPPVWGDVVGAVGTDGRYAGPNGVTNFMDVQATILAFQDEWKGADRSWFDISPEAPNGLINFRDVQLVILAWQGEDYPFSDPENCPASPPAPPSGNVSFRLVANSQLIDPGNQVVIDVFTDPTDEVAAYELGLEVEGGTTGTLSVTALNINKLRSDFIFTGETVADAADNDGMRLGATTSDGSAVAVTTSNDYLGTFTLTASNDAGGIFDVHVQGIDQAYLTDSDAALIGTSPGSSLYIGVDVDCAIDAHCDDSSQCTDDSCDDGVCQNTNNNCDDANDCTSDACNSGVCDHTDEDSGTPCDDGQFCTTPDTCDGAGACVGGPNDPCLPTELCIEFIDTCMPQQ